MSNDWKLKLFKRTILKKIFGPKENNEGAYEVRNDEEVEHFNLLIY